MYAGIGGCTASNNLICMHLKEDEGKMNMKIKNCMKEIRSIYI